MSQFFFTIFVITALGQVESLEEQDRRTLRELRERQGALIRVLPEFEKHVRQAAHMSKEDVMDVREKAVSVRKAQGARIVVLDIASLKRNQVGILDPSVPYVRERELREMPGALLISNGTHLFILVGFDVSDKKQDGKNVHFDGWLRVLGVSDKIKEVYVLEPFDPKVVGVK